MLRRSHWVVNPDTGERELIFDRPIAEIAEAVNRSRVVVRRQIQKMLTRGNPEKGGPALELVYQSHGRTASVYKWRRMDFVARFAPELLGKASEESRKSSSKTSNRSIRAPYGGRSINLYDLRAAGPEATIRHLGKKELNYTAKAIRQQLESLNISRKAVNQSVRVLMAVLWRAKVPIRFVLRCWDRLRDWIVWVRDEIGRSIRDLTTFLDKLRIWIATVLKRWREEEAEAARLEEECRRTEAEAEELLRGDPEVEAFQRELERLKASGASDDELIAFANEWASRFTDEIPEKDVDKPNNLGDRMVGAKSRTPWRALR